MEQDNKLSTIGLILLYIAFGLVLLYQYNGSFSESELRLFIELILTYAWTMGLMVYATLELNLKLFEPLSFISIIYEMIFVVKPIIDLNSRSMFEHGINVVGGGEKATLLVAIGFTVLFFSYYTTLKRRNDVISNEKSSSVQENYKLNSLALYIAWGVVFTLCIVGMLSKGLSLRYIFTLGNSGERIFDSDNIALVFLDNFGITLAMLWMMIMVKTKQKNPKLFITILSVIYLLIRNARWLMLIFILAPFVYYYVKNNKSPKASTLFIIAIVGLVLFAWMQANRTLLNTGGGIKGWGGKTLSLQVLLAPFESDLNTYKAFWSMVMRYPSQYMYLFGGTFLYTIVLFVPRVIWPGKPINPIKDVIEHSLNRTARITGTAVANIGEFYVNFGFLGVIGGMFIFGKMARFLKNTFLNKEITVDKCIIYSILYPLLFQWTARGNFCGNFYVTIFALLPYIFVWFISLFKTKEN